MTRYVAFLHGINVAGKNVVEMGDLKTYFESLGFHNVSTYLQTGNVLFETPEVDERVLCEKIGAYLEKAAGFKVPVIIRMCSELKSIIDNNPFDNIRSDEPTKWYITFLSDFPENDAKGSLGVYSNDAEYARIGKREVYIFARSYNTQTHFSNSFIERKLGLTATTRSWATVKKLSEL